MLNHIASVAPLAATVVFAMYAATLYISDTFRLRIRSAGYPMLALCMVVDSLIVTSALTLISLAAS